MPVFGPSCQTVSVAWEATCTNHDGIAAGRIELEAVEHCSLCELVSRLEIADN